jgi:uncharacterized protein YqgV (UPF0045/DUF77 family)
MSRQGLLSLKLFKKIAADYRKGPTGRLKSKVKSVKEKLK